MFADLANAYLLRPSFQIAATYQAPRWMLHRRLLHLWAPPKASQILHDETKMASKIRQSFKHCWSRVQWHCSSPLQQLSQCQMGCNCAWTYFGYATISPKVVIHYDDSHVWHVSSCDSPMLVLQRAKLSRYCVAEAHRSIVPKHIWKMTLYNH